MADKGTDAGFRGRAKRCLQIIAIARGDAQTGNVHQHRIAHARHGDGKGWRHAGEGGSELLRDRKFRKSHRYSCSYLYSASILLARAIAVQCAISSAMYLPNCGGVIGITLSASAANMSCRSGEASTLLIASLSFLVMDSGSLAGPTMPYQVSPLKPS